VSWNAKTKPLDGKPELTEQKKKKKVNNNMKNVIYNNNNNNKIVFGLGWGKPNVGYNEK